MFRAQFICKKCEKLKKNVKCWADVLAEKEYVLDVDTIPFPHDHICVLSGIELMKKEFKGLVKEKLRADPTQAVSKLYNIIRYFFYVQKKFEIYLFI